MREQELAELVSKTAALMEQFQRNCERMEASQAQVAAALQQLARQIPAQVEQSANRTFGELARQAATGVRGAIAAPVAEYEKQLIEASRQIVQGAHSLAAQIKRQETLSRHAAWKSLLAAGLAVLLLLAGGTWLSLGYRQEIERNRVSAQLLEAYNRADVVLCGEGALCANVDTRAPAVGEKQQYRIIRSRP
ncbi:hypothetical protein OK348_08010 [Flavobacterium sp. MXW15]|uniref:Relaxation protein n=1 Tax=Xanthomonas chitinilytica TaxID=2989819 RepID=A0ABT3JU02_9XANT|nr:relaxation protein [Xanthomonas sp. H13-6]MCW4454739.1 hypothetical protein [Flavobacterium sp. MXW15]MCW4471978.1 relaxation protein [Xanthomonas sp. H13-6]